MNKKCFQIIILFFLSGLILNSYTKNVYSDSTKTDPLVVFTGSVSVGTADLTPSPLSAPVQFIIDGRDDRGSDIFPDSFISIIVPDGLEFEMVGSPTITFEDTNGEAASITIEDNNGIQSSVSSEEPLIMSDSFFAKNNSDSSGASVNNEIRFLIKSIISDDFTNFNANLKIGGFNTTADFIGLVPTEATRNNPFGFDDTGESLLLTITVNGGTVNANTSNLGSITIVNNSPPPIAPIAEFIADKTSGSVPLTVNFTDQSTGDIISWLWNFGDGITSTQQSPSHTYITAGNYGVSLTVDGPIDSDTEIKTQFITVSLPIPTISPTPVSTPTPIQIPTVTPSITLEPTLISTPTPVTTVAPTVVPSITPEPTLISTPTPVTTVTPTATPTATPQTTPSSTPEETPEPEPTVCIAPVSDFIASTVQGKVPLTVQFTDISTDNPTEWLWDFGDGGKSISKNPVHKYELIGQYTVSLAVTNGCGEDEEIKTDFINALPIKSFTFKCGKELSRGVLEIETLVMELGLNEQCKLKLTNLEPGVLVDVNTLIRRGLRSSIMVEPARGTIDANGELEITITAVSTGIDWVAWAVPNENGEFEFSKRAYDTGLAWGMFVEVK